MSKFHSKLVNSVQVAISGHQDTIVKAVALVIQEVHVSQSARCSGCGSEAGSYLRLIDFVHHTTLGLRVISGLKLVGAK